MSTASTISGISTIDPDLTGVPARLGPLGDDDVDAGRLVAFGVLRPTSERADQLALLLAAVDQELRWRAECVHDQGGVVRQSDVEQRHRLLGTERCTFAGARRRRVGTGGVAVGSSGTS